MPNLNPLRFINDKLKYAYDAIRKAIRVELLQEDVRLALSRLATLDEENAEHYNEVLKHFDNQ